MTEQPEIVDEPRSTEPSRHGKAAWFRYSSAASVGIEMAVAIVGCTLFAGWLEREYTHWAPWTTVLGFAVGIGAAIKAIVRTAKQYQRELAEREPAGTAKQYQRELAEREREREQAGGG